ncbi:hypothetical protein DFO67_10258 [Modicisalibacter xianhensis]|uniref:Uncharacterized protein n=1 Tax=Modicisalibacter xianhensis TaxID=442341 RepID=A0A4R8FZE3_9GAMM|nr:hypothetical protein DFO67_10258 [Halomonas xianhensis]
MTFFSDPARVPAIVSRLQTSQSGGAPCCIAFALWAMATHTGNRALAITLLSNGLASLDIVCPR